MRFSSRLAWDIHPNPLFRLLEEKRRSGAKNLDLTESNPTHAGFVYPEIPMSSAGPYDPAPRGSMRARQAVSEYYRRRSVEIAPERIVLTASTSEAYSWLFKLLCEPGDEILTPRPSYPLFEFLAGLESIRVQQYPLRYDGIWHVDFAALEQSLTPRTRAIVVVNPNNPTGSFLKRSELARLEALAEERQLAILSDEVFSDYAFAPDLDRVTTLVHIASGFSMSGLSKIAGMPHLKLGWIVAPESALERLDWIADTYLSVGTPVQTALPSLLDAAESVNAQIRERTAANLALLQSRAAGSSANILRAEGGWYAVLQVPRTRTEEEWALTLLRDYDVLVQPGFFYDFESEAFLVLSLLTPTETFAEGLRRLLAIL